MRVLFDMLSNVTVWLHECSCGLQLDQHEYIFLPVNNNADVTEAEGGSHWCVTVHKLWLFIDIMYCVP